MNYKQKVGQFGENLVCDFLTKKGYKIIAQNVKLGFQEIDIITKKEDLIVFVEVKTRTNNIFGDAELAVDTLKINNLKKAIEKYIVINNLDGENIRLDLVVVDIKKEKKTANIKHYSDIL
jgi:putative endonuclease